MLRLQCAYAFACKHCLGIAHPGLLSSPADELLLLPVKSCWNPCFAVGDASPVRCLALSRKSTVCKSRLAAISYQRLIKIIN